MEHTIQKTSALRECRFFSKSLFIDNLKRAFYLPAILLVIMIMSGPFRLSNYLVQGSYIVWADVAAYANRICSPTLICVASFAVVLANFSFLFRRKASFYFNSLPMKRSTLFVTGIVSGLLMLLVPMIICALITLPLVGGVDKMLVTSLLLSMAISAGEIFFFFGLSLFIVMCTGIIVAAPIFYLIFNSLCFAFSIIISEVSRYFSFGWWAPDFAGQVTEGSPFWHLFMNGVGPYIDYYEKNNNPSLEVVNGGYVAIIALVGVVLVISSYIIFKQKHAESAGTLLPERWTRPVFRWGMGFFVSVFFAIFIRATINMPSKNYAGTYLVFSTCFVILGIGVFFISQILIEKKFRVFTKKLFAEALIMVTCFIVGLVLCDSLNSPQTYWIPQAEEVEYVEAYTKEGSLKAFSSDEKDMDLILKTHQALVDNKDAIIESINEYERAGYPPMDDYQHIYITYHLKDGTTRERAYDFPKPSPETEYSKQIKKLDAVIRDTYEDPDHDEEVMEEIYIPAYPSVRYD